MRLRELLFQNLWMKLLSLGLAVLIWFTVYLNKTDLKGEVSNPMALSLSRTFTNLPVLVLATAADVRDFKVRPTVVEVTLRGSAEAVRQLDGKDVRVEVFLTDIESARDLRKKVDVFAPPGFSIIEVKPPEVDVVVPPKR